MISQLISMVSPQANTACWSPMARPICIQQSPIRRQLQLLPHQRIPARMSRRQGGDAIAVPARSALLLGPTAVMSEPDNPDNPNNPDNPDNSDQPDKPSGDNAHNGANNAANGANNASASHGGTASTGSSIAVIIAMVIVLLIAGSGMLLRIHSPHERTLNRQETSA